MTKSTPTGTRSLKTRVKTARKRSNSSTRWLQRQLNDPYVKQAKRDGYRSRAAYKLLELDEKFAFLKPGKIVLDLGAAPGGWTQVAVAACKSNPEKPSVIGVDLLAIPAITGAHLMLLDFMDDKAEEKIKEALSLTLSRVREREEQAQPARERGIVDIVLSDMAPNTTGHASTDHIRIMGLLEAAYPFACEILKKNGVFVAKVFQGGAEKELLAQMKRDFTTVKHAKPKSSRSDSSEMYVVAMGFNRS